MEKVVSLIGIIVVFCAMFAFFSVIRMDQERTQSAPMIDPQLKPESGILMPEWRLD